MGFFCKCKNYDEELNFLMRCYDSLKKEVDQLYEKSKQSDPHIAEIKRNIHNLMKSDSRSKQNNRPLNKSLEEKK